MVRVVGNITGQCPGQTNVDPDDVRIGRSGALARHLGRSSWGWLAACRAQELGLKGDAIISRLQGVVTLLPVEHMKAGFELAPRQAPPNSRQQKPFPERFDGRLPRQDVAGIETDCLFGHAIQGIVAPGVLI